MLSLNQLKSCRAEKPIHIGQSRVIRWNPLGEDQIRTLIDIAKRGKKCCT